MENKKPGTGWIVVIVVIIIVIAAALALKHRHKETKISPNGETPTTTSAVFACTGGKTISAIFHESSTTSVENAGLPPAPNGSVELSLSDGRSLTLKQTLSADGARFANSDNSVVFWNVGNGATFTENGTSTYANCKAP